MQARDVTVRLVFGLTAEDAIPDGLIPRAREDVAWMLARALVQLIGEQVPEGTVVAILGLEDVPPGAEWPVAVEG